MARKMALIFIFAVSAVPAFGQASSLYIAQSATGGNNGSSCANAYGYTFFNAPGSWGTGYGQIGPGTTVHLCGTFSAPAQTTLLTFQGSGTSSSPITLLFEPGAVLQSPSWSVQGAINTNGKSHLTINGDATGGRQGTIENTDEGTALGYQAYSRAINADGCVGCTVENLSIENIYVHLRDQAISSSSGDGTTVTVTCPSTCNVVAGNSYGIYNTTASSLNTYTANPGCSVGTANAAGYCNVAVVQTVSANQFTYASSFSGSATGGVVSDGVLNNNFWNAVFLGNNTSPGITINNILAHDLSWVFPGWANNVTIENCEVYNADHGVAFGTNATVTGLSIHDNHFHDFANWDAVTQMNHHDYIHLWDFAAGTSVSGQIYNNRFDGNFGITTTAFIYLQGAIANMQVFNNTGIAGVPNYGKIAVHATDWGLGQSTGNSFYNNYFDVGDNTSVGTPLQLSGQLNVTVENNVLIGGASVISLQSGATISRIDHNLYENLTTDYNSYMTWARNLSYYTSFSAWQSACGCDSNSQAVSLSSLLFNANTGQPLAGSPAINLGLNLASLNLTALDSDAAGVLRPPSPAPWTAGPYQSTGLASTAPQPPTNLSASVN